MKYHFKEGVEKQKSRGWALFSVLGIFGGIYMLANSLSPALFEAITPADATAKRLVSQQPESAVNRAYIPKINVTTPIVPVEGDERLALEKGAIQRAATSGNPRDGGNFVVVANRFSLGLTPLQTKALSPFYYLNKLSAGDDIYIDYDGVRYAYEVAERKVVSASSEEIEARTADARLTLYASSAQGHEVVIAKPIGKVVWQGGKPLLKSL
jgi:LPXTG-site transpeptidase (sortase) family protein